MAPDMTAQDRPDFVPVAEAARVLGISTATVKRRIAAGTLEAEQLARPQGIEYRVRLGPDVPPPLSDVPGPFSERSPLEPVPLTAALGVTSHELSSAITAAVAPLAARLIVQDATIAEQVAAIRELERENGRLAAEMAALRTARETSHVSVPPEPVPDPFPVPNPPSPNVGPRGRASRWRRWWLALAGAVVG